MRKMMLNKYQELFDLAIDLQKISPWDNLQYSDQIILDDDGKNILYSVFELENGTRGIAFYEGDDSIFYYFELFKEGLDPSYEQQLIARQNFAICLYVRKEDLSTVEKKIYNLLKIELEEGKVYPTFFRKKASYPPRAISEDDAAVISKYLYHFIKIYEEINSGELLVNFDQNEFILRKYLPDKNEWINLIGSSLNAKIPQNKVRDIDLEEVKKIVKYNHLPNSLILDYRYLEYPVHDDLDKPYYPVVVALIDRITREVIEAKMCRPNEDYLEKAYEILMRYLMNKGIPAELVIIQEDVFCYLNQLFSTFNIHTIVTLDFSMTNKYFNYFNNELKIFERHVE